MVGFLATLAIALVLNIVAYLIMPKPKQAKPDAAKDLDDPVAEAGRPVPVVFGTITVKGLNVLHFTDKNKRTYKVEVDGGEMEVTDYYMSIHFGVCLGSVDKLKKIFVRDKVAWEGNVAGSAGVAEIDINKPKLFGGNTKEGGAVGVVTFLPGSSSQVLPDSLAYRMGRDGGEDCPAYRGITSLFFTGPTDPSAPYAPETESSQTTKTRWEAIMERPLSFFRRGRSAKSGFYWVSNQPYLPGVWAQVERAPKGLSAASAMIGSDANPAHIIYECLTNTDYGMGASSAIIDVPSFDAAATTLAAEGFGLSMLWTQQSDIQSFVSEVIDHIQATLFVHPATGLLTLRLIRADYDPATLPILDPDNADLSNYQRKGWGEIINEIVVTWTSPENEQEETVSFQDLGSIAAQGEVVSDGRNYYGVRNPDLAMMLASRDLASVSAPLVTADAVVDRSAWDVVPGDVVKLNWPERGVTGLVMRVGPVDYGRITDPTIKLSLAEDIFARDTAQYDPPPRTEWVDPSQNPTPITTAKVVTAPGYFLDKSKALESVAAPEVRAVVLASSNNTDCDSYTAAAQFPDSTGALVWDEVFTGTNIGRGLLVSPVVAEATSTVQFNNQTGGTRPQIGGFAWIGGELTGDAEAEIALITNIVGADCTLSRGVLDTVPRDWPAGTPVYFVGEGDIILDPRTRADGDSVDYRLLTETSRGTLDFDDAPALLGTLIGRPHYPLRPANVKARGQGFTPGLTELNEMGVETTIPITWANRNRLSETAAVLDWGDPTVDPEAGQTTTVEVRSTAGALVTAHTGLTGTSFDLPKASFGTERVGFVSVLSVRDGFESLQAHKMRVRVLPDPTIDFTGDASVGYELLSGDMTDGDDAILQSGS